MEEEFGSENLDDTRKQVLCSKLEKLIRKLDSHAAIIQIVKPDIAIYWLTRLNENKDYHRGLLKQYQQTAEIGNQTSLVSSTLAGNQEPNENVVVTEKGAIENVEEKVEVSSRHSATHRKRKQYQPTRDRSKKWSSKT